MGRVQAFVGPPIVYLPVVMCLFEISFAAFYSENLRHFYEVPMIRSDSFKLLSWLLETFCSIFLDTLYLTQANGMFLRRIYVENVRI
jgi:hypothetical protein